MSSPRKLIESTGSATSTQSGSASIIKQEKISNETEKSSIISSSSSSGGNGDLDAEPLVIRDGQGGWTDLKSNRLMRRQFFEYFNKHRNSCLECQDNTPSTPTSLSISKMTNYYYTSERKYSLEEYYYGSCPGDMHEVVIANDIDNCPKEFKCSECNENSSKSKFFRHVAAHFQWKDATSKIQEDQICKYCLKPVKTNTNMTDHVNKYHIMLDTKGYCCRICCKVFKNEVDTTLHMWKNHCESETPYKCPLCGFRTSFLYSMVDHFELNHVNEKICLCPLCLMPIPCNDILKKVVAIHIKTHLLECTKKCNSCALNFAVYSDYIQHMNDKSLHSSGKTKKGFQTFTPSPGFPRLLMAKDPNPSVDESCTHMKKNKVVMEEKSIQEDEGSEIDQKCFAMVMKNFTSCQKLGTMKNE